MPKTRIVTLAASAYTNIRASIPGHYLRVEQNAATKSKAFMYKRADDGFGDVWTLETGKPIEYIGHGRSGLVGRPPNYSAVGYPAETAASSGDSGGGDIVVQVKTSDDSSIDVIVFESESEL